MKKYFLRTFGAIALTLCISSCGNSPQEEQTVQNTQTEQTISETAAITTTSEILETETTAKITEKVQDKDDKTNSLETPIVFAACFLDDAFPEFNGKSLVLEMTEGSYDYENSFFESAWEGSFRFRLTESDKNSNYEILNSDITSYPIKLAFNEPFDISVDDYNNDGYPDFAINQWGSLSGGTDCYLFTLTKYGKVKPINVMKNDEKSKVFWLPKTYRSVYSPAFEKEGENLFSISYFTSGGVSENEIPLISHDVIDDWFSAHNGFDMSEFTLKNIYEWGDGFVVLKEQQILEPDGSIWYSSDFLWQYPHLKTIVNYVLTDLQDEPSFMPENEIIIELADFNNDGNTDAFILTASMGINYCMVDNIKAPKLVHDFFAFDMADFLCDTKTGQFVIKYEKHYGLNVYATSETNFIFVGDEITEISHVHFEGTSGPEEFYIVDENGEKTVCGEADINASIAEIEKNLQPFDGDTEIFRITVKDSDTTIEKISD